MNVKKFGGQQKDVAHPTNVKKFGGQQKDVAHPTNCVGVT